MRWHPGALRDSPLYDILPFPINEKRVPVRFNEAIKAGIRIRTERKYAH
jgi:hypothetical protein